MSKIIFNAQMLNTGRRIKAISGRLGNFIFRSYKNGKITAFYKPKHVPLSVQCATNMLAIMDQLREMTDQLGLYITSYNYDEQP